MVRYICHSGLACPPLAESGIYINKGELKIKRFYRLNQYIKAEKVRVIDSRENQVGVMPLGEALFKARQKGLDLVEVAANASPPVCKIIDFKKFKYQEDKKQRAGKKKGKSKGSKEIRFTPFIAQGDYKVRIQRGREFLTEGHVLKLSVKFVGRQITRKQFGYELLQKAHQQLSDISKPLSEAKMHGRILSMSLKPSGGSKDAKTKN